MFRFLCVLCVLTFLISASATLCRAEEKPSTEEVQKITQAMPEEARVAVEQPRKLLVFSLCCGFRHGSIPYGQKTLQIMGEKTGVFQAVISDDIAMFEPENISQFDAICMNNCTGECFLPKNFGDLTEQQQAQAKKTEQRLKKSFLDFISNGGGLIGIHAATDCFYQWPEYGKVIGAYFKGHPWNEEVTLKLDSPDHPLSQVFSGKPFAIADEIYQFTEPYSRENLRILLSLDTDKTDMNKNGIHRTDNDFAVSWVREYGDGRVFYCSLGHRPEVFWNPILLQFYLEGIQFAMGDLPGDTTPSAPRTKDKAIGLFDGKNLDQWSCKPGSWVVNNEAMERRGGGDIWSKERFGDFVLDLEFMVGKGTNSGIFFRTDNIKDCVQTGIEVQVLDSHGKQKVGRHDCGAIYDIIAPKKNMAKKPGEWNHLVLTAKASKINVTMNGEVVIDIDLDDWTEPNKNPDGSGNKFRTPYKDMPREGHIGFQDHGKPVWYRNVKVTALD